MKNIHILQETLEEAANRLLYNKYPYHPPQDSGYWKDVFKEGAKWQQEKMYSEEEILKSFDNLGFKQISSEELNSLPYQPFITDENGNIWVIDKEKWFEQFKKKV